MSTAESPAADVARIRSGDRSYDVVVPDAATDHIQHHLAETGSPYEAAMLERMRAALRPGDVVVDVGANVGNHTLYLACLTQAHVVAVEPDPHLAAAIERSAELNDVTDHVDVHACAAGAAAGVARLRRPDPTNLGTQTLVPGDVAEGEALDVPVRTVDDIVGRRPVRMLKVDVEGFEVQVLEGAMTTVRRSRPLIWIECLDEPDFRAVAAVLEPLGYRVHDLQNASPTLLFVPTAPAAAAAPVPGVDAALGRVYAERRTVETLRRRLLDRSPHEGGAIGEGRRAEARWEADEERAAHATTRSELAAARRRIESLEAQVRQDDADFRVLRDFVEQIETRLWEARRAQTAREQAADRLRELEDALDAAAREKRRAAEKEREARAALRRVRSSRAYRVGRALGDTRTLAGAQRALPRLISIIREHKKEEDA